MLIKLFEFVRRCEKNSALGVGSKRKEVIEFSRAMLNLFPNVVRGELSCSSTKDEKWMN